ncbi:MAG: hypothetical protein IJ073_07580 [Lachnospiraceae bacterium]|nr:hypothetical protein [Lachnospiraceae bacterium]
MKRTVPVRKTVETVTEAVTKVREEDPEVLAARRDNPPELKRGCRKELALTA